MISSSVFYWTIISIILYWAFRTRLNLNMFCYNTQQLSNSIQVAYSMFVTQHFAYCSSYCILYSLGNCIVLYIVRIISPSSLTCSVQYHLSLLFTSLMGQKPSQTLTYSWHKAQKLNPLTCLKWSRESTRPCYSCVIFSLCSGIIFFVERKQ